MVGSEEAGLDAAQVFDAGNVSETLRRYRVSDLMRVTGLPRRTIYDLRNGTTTTPSPETIAALKRGLAFLRHRPQELATACGWHGEDLALRRQSCILDTRLMASYNSGHSLITTSKEVASGITT